METSIPELTDELQQEIALSNILPTNQAAKKKNKTHIKHETKQKSLH